MTSPLDNDLEYAIFDTEWGWLGVVRSFRGLVSLALPCPTVEGVLGALGVTAYTGRRVPDFAGLEKKLRNYLSGKREAFDEVLDLASATPFRRRVWLAAQKIPYGEVRSYAWVAGRLGNPKACRAVGQALGENPLPIVIPCHRVIASSGALGGFSGGLPTKRRLLELEGISCPRS